MLFNKLYLYCRNTTLEIKISQCNIHIANIINVNNDNSINIFKYSMLSSATRHQHLKHLINKSGVVQDVYIANMVIFVY